MQMNLMKAIFILSLLQLAGLTCGAQDIRKTNSIALGPMGDIFILQYGHLFKSNNEFIAGVSYTNPGILN